MTESEERRTGSTAESTTGPAAESTTDTATDTTTDTATETGPGPAGGTATVAGTENATSDPRPEPKPEPKAATGSRAGSRAESGERSRAESGERKKEKGASPVPAMIAKVRLYLSRLVWIICVLAALALAVGALLIALDANKHNGLVKGVLDLAKVADLGVFSLDSPIKQFHAPDALTKTALLNYGLGALAWLVVGRIIASIVRPRS